MEARYQQPNNLSKRETEGAITPLRKKPAPTMPPIFSSRNQKMSSKQTKSWHLVLCLNRIRDFMRLFLSYPMRTPNDNILKVWTKVPSNGHRLLEEHYRLQREKPLRYLAGLIPVEIIKDIEAGGKSMLADKNGIPDAILNLAVDLAIRQLIQTLLSGEDYVRNLHYVMLLTRNGVEKREVMGKIEATLKDEENLIRLHETFVGALCIDVSIYQSQVEIQVRQQIAQQLQLPMIEEDEVKGDEDWLITRIEEEMSSNKYLVLLVDGDAEEPLDLQKVGLSKTKLSGIVALITTESPKQENDPGMLAMDLKIRIEDHLLPWQVFCCNVGNKLVRSSSAIQQIAVHIVEECGGHLLANVLVAKSLKNVKDVQLWELALKKLCSPNPSYDISMFHGISKAMVHAFINFIWDGINKTQKHCLACCLFIPKIKEGELDNDLMNEWISSLLVDDEAGEHNLRELVDRSILMQFESTRGRYIRLPEDTYAILQSLNTLNPLFMRKIGIGLTKPPKNELWHSAIHVELKDNKLSELPLSPNCLELKVLKLQGNVDLTNIPCFFFINTPLLCILDLSYTSIKELPDCLFELEQLRELYMKGCECFMKLSPKIGKLNKLEMLDFEKTQIIHLPEEIQELTNLQSLTFYFYEYRGKKSMQYTFSTIIPYGVLSKLRRLKCLSIDVNPNDERWYENVQVILLEIMGLECLRSLSLYIPQLELSKFIPAHIFELDFRFIVGWHMEWIISGRPPTDEKKFKQSECSLTFVKGVDLPSEIKKLVRHSKALFLDRHMTIKNLTEFEMMNLEQLRVCILVECKEMQAIVDGRHLYSNNDMMSHMLYLSVSYMKNLRSIWEGPVSSSCSFGMLKFLALYNCPKLTTIFTLDFLSNLSLLKEIIVKDCPKVSTLINHRSSKLKEEILLPKLKKLLLLHLPELINISNGLQIGPRLEKMGIYDCPKLQSLSKVELSSQTLMIIKGDTNWWEALKWSEAEWGKAVRPSNFDGIFSSINKEADIMTQLMA